MHPLRSKICAAVLGLLSGFAHPAQAHDPGLSAAGLRISGNQLFAQLTFARPDIEPLAPLDVDHDGSVSPEEWAAVRPRLQTLGGDAVEVSVDGQRVTAHTVAVELDASDTLHFELTFPYRAGARLSVDAPIIQKLPRGHRQYVTFGDAQGLIHAGILSSDSSHLLFNLKRAVWWRQFGEFVWEGVWHIWIGLDHILFLLALLLPAALVIRPGHWRAREDFKATFIGVIKIVSAFTAAHSITLSLAVFGLISLPGRLVEPVIAASVIVAALNNLFPRVHEKLWSLAFGFGLIHGMGFARVLVELGLPEGTRGLALAGFNIGVELGQLAIVAVALPAIFTLREQGYYRWAFLQAGSWAIAGVSTVWLVERMSDVEVIPWL